MAAELDVSEIFESIQGEGVHAGTPSVFVRLADCNLRCTWCDTKYSWDWKNYDREREIKRLEVDDLVEQIRAGKPRNLVLTGGEPLLQQAAAGRLATAIAADFTIEVETAGTLVPDETLRATVTTWNVSPKLAASGNGLKARRRDAPLRYFAPQPNAWFKFVVADEDELAEIEELVAQYGIGRERVLLLPNAENAAQLAETGPRVADLAMDTGFRYSHRIHVTLWGGERAK